MPPSWLPALWRVHGVKSLQRCKARTDVRALVRVVNAHEHTRSASHALTQGMIRTHRGRSRFTQLSKCTRCRHRPHTNAAG